MKNANTMANIYFYPKIDYKKAESPNPYIYNLENSLSKNHKIVNKNYNRYGILDLFRYLPKTDIYFLNWIEDLPALRYGKFQVLVFVVFTYLTKLLGIKIYWILHNKYSHDTPKNKWTDFMFKFIIEKSNYIVTHSNAGVDFIKHNFPEQLEKVKYLVLPIEEIFPELPIEDKIYDFLIWGTIYPYKGVLQFLKFMSEDSKLLDIRVLIVGSCPSEEYKKVIKQHLSTNIIYHDGFYELEEIAKFANKSKFILFTYNANSVTSSSSLMDSIRMRCNIVGPNGGAFKDLSSYNFITTYDSYDELPNILYNQNENSNWGMLENFCKENSWDMFNEKLEASIGF